MSANPKNSKLTKCTNYTLEDYITKKNYFHQIFCNETPSIDANTSSGNKVI